MGKLKIIKMNNHWDVKFLVVRLKLIKIIKNTMKRLGREATLRQMCGLPVRSASGLLFRTTIPSAAERAFRDSVA